MSRWILLPPYHERFVKESAVGKWTSGLVWFGLGAGGHDSTTTLLVSDNAYGFEVRAKAQPLALQTQSLSGMDYRISRWENTREKE